VGCYEKEYSLYEEGERKERKCGNLRKKKGKKACNSVGPQWGGRGDLKFWRGIIEIGWCKNGTPSTLGREIWETHIHRRQGQPPPVSLNRKGET